MSLALYIFVVSNNVDDQQDADVSDEVRILRERIDKECPNSMGWSVVSLLESLKALEKQEFDFRSQRSSDCSRLQQEIDELDKMLHSGRDDEDSDKFHHSFQESNCRLESAKQELAAKLRSIVSLKRQLGEVASQAELIQYPSTRPGMNFGSLNLILRFRCQISLSCFSNVLKNCLIRYILLILLLHAKFQNAITSADGRIKLINSLEGILNGTQQKLERVELTQQSEQKLYDSVKGKYAAAISEQRQSSSLLKLFQEECARNERLRAQIHEH
ncbi:hypothetical protein DH2020_025277 [Rehmannia glutinosa]|uniref:CCDC93 coiled-coil domain-containing protein n=1 Tax=Rehmannia glutinosa TaxID=99300 RepID=A0ABR0W1X3_REHGL